MSIQQAVQVFNVLMQGSFSRVELARRADVTPKFAGRVLQTMKEQKMIYVIDYTNEADGRNRVKIYALGSGVDAEPKPTQPQAARSRKSYVRKVAARKQANIKTAFVGGKGLWQ
jgi:hypothetical protein